MSMKEYIGMCLKSIETERQLADADKASGNQSMYAYHRGRMQVWLSVHTTLVRYFSDS